MPKKALWGIVVVDGSDRGRRWGLWGRLSRHTLGDEPAGGDDGSCRNDSIHPCDDETKATGDERLAPEVADELIIRRGDTQAVIRRACGDEDESEWATCEPGKFAWCVSFECTTSSNESTNDGCNRQQHEYEGEGGGNGAAIDEVREGPIGREGCKIARGRRKNEQRVKQNRERLGVPHGFFVVCLGTRMPRQEHADGESEKRSERKRHRGKTLELKRLERCVMNSLSGWVGCWQVTRRR